VVVVAVTPVAAAVVTLVAAVAVVFRAVAAHTLMVAAVAAVFHQLPVQVLTAVQGLAQAGPDFRAIEVHLQAGLLPGVSGAT
jgi:hypothetical protein